MVTTDPRSSFAFQPSRSKVFGSSFKYKPQSSIAKSKFAKSDISTSQDSTDAYHFPKSDSTTFQESIDESLTPTQSDQTEFEELVSEMGNNVVKILEENKILKKNTFNVCTKIIFLRHRGKWELFEESVKEKFPQNWTKSLEWNSSFLAYHLVQMYPPKKEALNIFNLLSAQFFIKMNEEYKCSITEINDLLKFCQHIVPMGQNVDNILKKKGQAYGIMNIMNNTKKIHKYLEKLNTRYDGFNRFIICIAEILDQFPENYSSWKDAPKWDINRLTDGLTRIHPSKSTYNELFNLLAVLFFIKAVKEGMKKPLEIVDLLLEKIDEYPVQQSEMKMLSGHNSESSNTEV